jgi:hypothetical protein
MERQVIIVLLYDVCQRRHYIVLLYSLSYSILIRPVMILVFSFLSKATLYTLQQNKLRDILSFASYQIFPLKPGFRLIKRYYDSHGTWKYFRLRQISI